MTQYRPVPADEVLYHGEAGEAFLLHVPTGEYFGLNHSGVVVWKAVRDGLDPLEELVERWPDVPKEALQRDAIDILRTLCDAGLVVESDVPPDPR